MATRRTTMRSRKGTKLYAVRDDSGKFKDIQTFKRAHGADVRRKSKAERTAAQGTIEKGVRKVGKAANEAVKSVRSSVEGAVAAVRKVAKRAAKQVTGKAAPAKKAARKSAKKK